MVMTKIFRRKEKEAGREEGLREGRQEGRRDGKRDGEGGKRDGRKDGRKDDKKGCRKPLRPISKGVKGNHWRRLWNVCGNRRIPRILRSPL